MSAGVGSKYYSGFNPLNIGDCALWLDAADTSTLTLSGSNVTTWRDKSGNSANATGVNNPTYDSTSIGVNFVRTSSQHMTLPNGCLPFNDSSYSYFFIFTPRSNVSGQTLIYGGSAAVLRDSFGLRTGDAGTGTLQTYWIGYDLQTSTRYTLNTKNFGATYYASGGGRSVWINFAQGASDTPGVTRIQTQSNNGIGGLRATSSDYLDGQIHEIIVYNSSLSTTQRQQVEAYLAWKWFGGSVTRSSLTTFLPTQVSGCDLWLDGGDPTTLTLSGSNVTTWADKSGNARNATQGTTGRQPTAVSTGVLFTAANSNFMSMNVPFSQSHSFFIVATMQASGGSYLVSRQNVLGAGPSVLMYPDRIRYIDVSDDTNFLNGSTLPGRVLISYTRSQGVSVVGFLNGVQVFSITQSYSTNGTIAYNLLGCTNGTENFYDGILSELIYFNSALSTTQRQQVENYLSSKWGISRLGLPTTHPYSSILPVTRPFQPIDIGGCALWLDAADSSTITLSGSNVKTWADKSGNGYNLSQSSAGNRPTYSNGVVNFNAASSNSMSNTSTNVFGATGTVFIVMNIQSTTSTMRPFSIGNGNTYITFDSANAATASYYNNTSGYFSASNQSASTTGNRHIRMVQRNGSVVPRYSVNGGTITNMESADVVVSSTMHITVGTGGSFATTAFLTGHIAEIIGYTSYLSDSDIRQVEGYLARKWGLQGSLSSLTTFIPTQISGCALWLDAVDPNGTGVPPQNNTSISSWRDKSSNSNSPVVRGTVPIYQTNSFNSRFPSLFFNVSQYFGTFPTYTGTTLTGFLVANPSAANTQGTRFISLANSSNPDWASTGTTAMLTNSFPSSGFYRTERSPLGVNYSTAVGTPALTNVIFDGTNCLFFANGTLVATNASSGSFNISLYSIGDGVQDNRGGQSIGNFCEVIIYTSALNISQRQQVEGYLARKWGLAGSLPSTHPFVLAGLPSTHPFISRLPMTTSFNPRQISGCALWLDAADRYTLTLSGSNVTTWADKSGNARNTSGVSGTPVLSNNSILSRQGVYFNGSSYFTGPFSYSSNTLSWFVVGTVESDGEAFGRLLSLGASGQFDFDSALRMNALSREGTTTELVSFRNYSFIARNMNISYGTPFVTSSVINGTSNFPFLNGTLATGGATSTNFGFTTYGISGSFGANIQRNKGFIFEVLIYTGALTSNERQQVEGYLAWKWGLQGPSSSLQYTAFTPTTISGCVLWLDAADSATVTLSGSNVTAWADKSGNARNASVVGTITRSNTINGVNAMVYSGASNTYFTGAVTNTGTTLTAIAVFLMNAASAASARVLSLGVPGTFDYNSALYAGPIQRRVGSSLGSFRNMVGVGLAAVIGVPTLFASVYTGSSNIIFLNGGTSNSGASTGSFGYTNYEIGTAFGEEASNPFSGSVGEVIVYNAALTTTERQQIEGYLAIKWGLQGNLPSTHPFANRGLPSTHPYKTISPI